MLPERTDDRGISGRLDRYFISFLRKIVVSSAFSEKQFSSPSIIWHSIFSQHSRVRRINWQIYERKTRYYNYLFETRVFVLKVPKFRKPSIIRHSIFSQHSCVGRPIWRIFEGEPCTTTFFLKYSFYFVGKLGLPRKFSKAAIIGHSIFRQHSHIGRPNWQMLERKVSTKIGLSKT